MTREKTIEAAKDVAQRKAYRLAQSSRGMQQEFRSGRIISRITSDTEEFGRVTQLIADILSRLVMVVVLSSTPGGKQKPAAFSLRRCLV